VKPKAIAPTRAAAAQIAAAGDSSEEIHEEALRLAAARPGLAWLDIGCGRGDVLRAVRDRLEPSSLTGVDVIDWLADDLREDVQLSIGQVEEVELGSADRVLMIEVIEHLDAPWGVLRAAIDAVAPGGRIVLTTPSLTNLRARLGLAVSGSLPTFRSDNEAHLSPALPHVSERLMREAGLVTSRSYCARDVIPLTGGRRWPVAAHSRLPELTSISVSVVGVRPLEPGAPRRDARPGSRAAPGR
jgi:2-polyprenyl-3-methyl-5-hydroxy-6-metoxy-1,4-benzoquinol methylase